MSWRLQASSGQLCVLFLCELALSVSPRYFLHDGKSESSGSTGIHAAFLSLQRSDGEAGRAAEPPAAEVLGACRGRAAAGKGGRGDFGSDMPEVKDGEKQLSQKKELFKLGGRFLLLQKVG